MRRAPLYKPGKLCYHSSNGYDGDGRAHLTAKRTRTWCEPGAVYPRRITPEPSV